MNKLKELRKEKKLTQKELADKINVSKITVLRWENGERQIKPDKAQQLADFFGVSVGYLLGYSDYKNEDSYYEKMEETHTLDVDILNSIDTIGEKNLSLLYEFFEKEFKKEYAPVFKYVDEVDGWSFDEMVKTAMGNVSENLWGLPNSVVKLILYWCTLEDNERKSLLEVIKTLSLNNLGEDLLLNNP